jgi:hypothetical protein
MPGPIAVVARTTLQRVGRSGVEVVLRSIREPATVVRLRAERHLAETEIFAATSGERRLLVGVVSHDEAPVRSRIRSRLILERRGATTPRPRIRISRRRQLGKSLLHALRSRPLVRVDPPRMRLQRDQRRPIRRRSGESASVRCHST